ncbi:MAG: hypothetical protein HGA24_11550, partial [Candidatus Aminicenantes bacterium]|nr:hypothetical protein [Candidatus Aminicenantes bacterium]
MSAETSSLTTVSAEDIALVERELERTPHPQSTKALTAKLAFEKTATERTQDVKKYDSYARYDVGDFIEKEYNEPLTVGSKSVEHFEGRVILKVVGKTFSKHFNCEMLEVEYPGGGVFRKYLDYMKKTHTQVLLPSGLDGRSQNAEIMAKGDDPRLTELPMTERVMLDHLSLAWANDEMIDIIHSSEVTVQWSTIEESDPTGHAKGVPH